MNTPEIVITLLACSALLGGMMIVISGYHKWRAHIDETEYWREMGELYANFLKRCAEIERQNQEKIAQMKQAQERQGQRHCRHPDNL
jgi:hypothetical protein